MKTTVNYESLLWGLLAKERLADLSQFHHPGFCDEVPLYSRDSQVRFLPRGKSAANAILLQFALKFLNSVIAYEEHRSGYFAAITAWDDSPGPLVPNLFVSCGHAYEHVEKLTFEHPATAFGTRVKNQVMSLGLGAEFKVFEENSTDSNSTRVFIGPARASYPGFVTLEALSRPKTSTRRDTQPRRSANGGYG